MTSRGICRSVNICLLDKYGNPEVILLQPRGQVAHQLEEFGHPLLFIGFALLGLVALPLFQNKLLLSGRDLVLGVDGGPDFAPQLGGLVVTLLIQRDGEPWESLGSHTVVHLPEHFINLEKERVCVFTAFPLNQFMTFLTPDFFSLIMTLESQ